ALEVQRQGVLVSLQDSRRQRPEIVGEPGGVVQLGGLAQRPGVQDEQVVPSAHLWRQEGAGHGCSQGSSTRSSRASAGLSAVARSSSAGLNLVSTSWRIAAQAGP